MIKFKILYLCAFFCLSVYPQVTGNISNIVKDSHKETGSETELIVESENEGFGSRSSEVTSSIPTSEDLGNSSSAINEEGHELLVGEVKEGSVLEENHFSLIQKPALKSEESEAYLEGSLDLGEIENEKPIRRGQVSARYLGVLAQAGIDFKVFNQVSMGLYYGKFQGKVAGSDKNGVIPDLHHLNLQTTVFLNAQKQAFQTGGQLRFGIHGNQQSESDLVDSIEVDGQEVIKPGQTKVGALIGIGYGWYGDRFGLNVGAEYLSLGALKSLIPIVLSLGVTF